MTFSMTFENSTVKIFNERPVMLGGSEMWSEESLPMFGVLSPAQRRFDLWMVIRKRHKLGVFPGSMALDHPLQQM